MGRRRKHRFLPALWCVRVPAPRKQHNAAPASSSLHLLLRSYDQFLPATVTVTVPTSSLSFLRKPNPSLQALPVRQSERGARSSWGCCFWENSWSPLSQSSAQQFAPRSCCQSPVPKRRKTGLSALCAAASGGLDLAYHVRSGSLLLQRQQGAVE